jgi:hypothetical protein
MRRPIEIKNKHLVFLMESLKKIFKKMFGLGHDRQNRIKHLKSVIKMKIKPRHSFKVHLFGGISRKGLTPLIDFKGKMCSGDYQNRLRLSVKPFIQKFKKFPFRHRFFRPIKIFFYK